MIRHVDTPQTRCRAGLSRTDITPPVGIYHRMWGAASHDRATGVHRPLTATGLWLEPFHVPAAARLLIGMDHCVVETAVMKQLQAAAAEATSLDPEHVRITLSHTHGSGWLSPNRAHFPGGELIGPYLEELTKKLADLARAAKQAAEPATLIYGVGRCDLAAHRDYRDDDSGQFACGFNPSGPADDTVLVIRIAADNNRCLGTIVNYACHPTTLAWDNTAISPDYLGAFREVVEGVTSAPCLFLQGASGDLGPREGFVGDWAIADRNGRQLGYAALSALEALPAPGTRFVYAGPVISGATIGTWQHRPLAAVDLDRQQGCRFESFVVELPYRHDLPTLEATKAAHERYRAEEEAARAAGDEVKTRDCRALVEQMHRQTVRLSALPPGRAFPFDVQLWRLGDAIWILTPGELYQVFQTTLRERFAGRAVVVATLTGDWQPGYLPTAASYGHGIYQEKIAALEAGTLEELFEVVARRIAGAADSPVSLG